MRCMRPGMELVVSPHKSIAELGVIGRAEDMHKIVDAERDATMAYLDEVVWDRGGRRGRAQLRTPTEGLTWAVSRHATTRAGDPQVHDHVLVANLVSMGDERGGWKALDTGLLRDHLHAATAVGRMAAAAKAVELGYGIEPDPGRSGRLGGWAISGIPKKPGKYTPTVRPRSKRPSALTPPTVLARWRHALHGTARATSASRTRCRAGGRSWLGQATQPRAGGGGRARRPCLRAPLKQGCPRWPRCRAARPWRAARLREDLHPRRRHRRRCASSARLCPSRSWTARSTKCLRTRTRSPFRSSTCQGACLGGGLRRRRRAPYCGSRPHPGGTAPARR